MQIKRFQAPNMSEALRMVKKEFGLDAVILSAVGTSGRKTLFGNQKRGVEVTAATDNYFSVYGNASSEPQADPQPVEKKTTSNRTGFTPWRKGAFSTTLEAEKKAAKRPTHAVKDPTRIRTRELFTVYHLLQSHGVTEAVAMELTTRLRKVRLGQPVLDADDTKPYLTDVLESMGVAAKPIKLGSNGGKIVAFIGPTGTGKTTTAAKVAALAKYRKRTKKVAMISIDAYRITGAAMLEKYAEIIDVPFRFASNRRELFSAIQHFRDNDLVIIDSPGVNPRDEEMVHALQEQLVGSIPVEIHLLLSATTKEEDLAETIDRYAVMPVSRLIFTKMDETGSLGGIINQLVRTKLPVSYFTCGPRVPEDIETVTAEKIAARLIEDDRRQTIWSEPPEVIADAMEKFEQRMTNMSAKEGFASAAETGSYNRYGKYFDPAGEEKMAAGY